jgi:hypothetical protein
MFLQLALVEVVDQEEEGRLQLLKIALVGARAQEAPWFKWCI